MAEENITSPEELGAEQGRDYEIGYGKPPKGSRFRKGQSGNPKGRPKGSVNTATVLHRLCRERIDVSEGGSRRKMSKLEATLRQLLNKALSGDLRAMREFLDRLDEKADPATLLLEQEADGRNQAKIVADFRERMSKHDQAAPPAPEKPESTPKPKQRFINVFE